MKILIIKLIVIFCSFNSCTQNHYAQTKISRECLLLNDSAFKYITRYNLEHNPKDLDTALLLLKQATVCDSNYFIAYSNMANTYNLMGNYKAEIETLNKMLGIHKNDWWVLTRKGQAYQKIDDMNSAKRAFYLAHSICQEAMKKDPQNVRLIINYITFKSVSYGKNAGLQELNRQVKIHPTLKSELINGTNL